MKKVFVTFMLFLGFMAFGSIAFAVSLDEFKAAFGEEMTVDQVSAKLAEANGKDLSGVFLGLEGDTKMAKVYKDLDNDAELKDQFTQMLELVKKVK
jgi:hypothetical protein